MAMESLKQEVFYGDETFQLSFQEYDKGLYMHCIVQHWKPSVLKKMYQVFSNFEDSARARGCLYIATVSPNPKFAKLFGGSVINKFSYEKKEYEVIVWELKY